MAQPRCHMPYVAHRAVVTIHCADTQANDAHATIFGIVGTHGLPKCLTDAVVAVRTDTYRVLDARERGWIEVGKDETWYTSLTSGFKDVVRSDNVVRQYRRPGSMHTGICCQVDHRVHAVEG